jgi:hypothetical protein
MRGVLGWSGQRDRFTHDLMLPKPINSATSRNDY